METIIIQLLSAFVGSLGFALVFNNDKKTMLPATFGGMFGWAVYLVFEATDIGVFLATIAAAAFCQLYSEVFSRVLKTPKTSIYITSIVPLVPGGSLYRTMYSAANSDWAMFRSYGATTLKVAFGIGIGASFVAAILLLLPKKKKSVK